jgi:hypothetical protein
LQTKVLRALQYFPLPEGTSAQKQLHDVLQAIFNGKLLDWCMQPQEGSTRANVAESVAEALYHACALS